MTEVTKTWLAVSALGAGLIHMATGASAPVALAVPLIVIGVAELAWGAASLVRDRVPFRRAAPFVALAPVLGWAGLVTAGTTFEVGFSALLPLLPMAAASSLDLFIALLMTVSARRHPRSTITSATAADATPAQPWRFVLALALGAVCVSLVTVPALADTNAGHHAVLVHELHGGRHH